MPRWSKRSLSVRKPIPDTHASLVERILERNYRDFLKLVEASYQPRFGGTSSEPPRRFMEASRHEPLVHLDEETPVG